MGVSYHLATVIRDSYRYALYLADEATSPSVRGRRCSVPRGPFSSPGGEEVFERPDSYCRHHL